MKAFYSVDDQHHHDIAQLLTDCMSQLFFKYIYSRACYLKKKIIIRISWYQKFSKRNVYFSISFSRNR